MKARDLIALLRTVDGETEIGVGSGPQSYYFTRHEVSHGPVKLMTDDCGSWVLGIDCRMIEDSRTQRTIVDGRVVTVQQYFELLKAALRMKRSTS